MDSPTPTMSPIGAPLHPISPERVNRLQQQPQSPSMPIADPFLDRTPGGGVQNKVAQFNNLSRETTQKRKDHEAALRRAVLGREEAESETRRLKDENKTLREKLEQAREREVRVAKKIEVFGEEKRKLIDHQHKCQKISEQEVRRARKEAFKFSSALVTAQEDVQKARGHMESLREQADVERHRGKKYQQEAFDAQLAMAGMEEETQGLKRKLSALEEERDALKTSLGDEQVARIAAEGRLPLPPAADPEDEFASPRKSKARRISARRESLKENMDPSWQSSKDIFDIMWAAEEGDEFAIAKRNLWVEEKRRQDAEMMITYLKAEYQHKPCNCESIVVQAAQTLQQGESKYVKGSNKVPVDTAAPSASTTETQIEVNQMVGDETMVHHEVAREHEAHRSGAISPAVSTQSEPAPFAIHEDESESSAATETSPNAEPTRKASLAPLAPSVSPSLLDLEANKENSLDTLEHSILSIKSEDIETSMSYVAPPRQQPNIMDTSISYSLTPRDIPAAVTEPVKPPSRQVTPAYTSHTTTISVPLKSGDSPAKPSPFPFSPGATMTREQALEAIKQRRGRARSVHAMARTPAKNELRNISSKSAPAM